MLVGFLAIVPRSNFKNDVWSCSHGLHEAHGKMVHLELGGQQNKIDSCQRKIIRFLPCLPAASIPFGIRPLLITLLWVSVCYLWHSCCPKSSVVWYSKGLCCGLVTTEKSEESHQSDAQQQNKLMNNWISPQTEGLSISVNWRIKSCNPGSVWVEPQSHAAKSSPFKKKKKKGFKSRQLWWRAL